MSSANELESTATEFLTHVRLANGFDETLYQNLKTALERALEEISKADVVSRDIARSMIAIIPFLDASRITYTGEVRKKLDDASVELLEMMLDRI
jgi:hypothetical protein